MVGVCRELAALGFDEILLDNWAFPTDGELGWIKADANYPADGRTAALEVFLEEVRAGLAEFPEVKVSLGDHRLRRRRRGGGERPDRRSAGARRPRIGAPGEGETLPRLNQTRWCPCWSRRGRPGRTGPCWP